jgi:hypothetical protein
MLRFIHAIAVVGALTVGWSIPVGITGAGGVAVAQTATPSPGASGANPSGQAPVGHRQPRADQVVPDTDRQKKVDEREAEEQRRLDRVLRNICRGC